MGWAQPSPHWPLIALVPSLLATVDVPDQERSRLLGSLSVIVLQHVCVGLQKETDVRVPDAFTYDLRTHSSLQSSRRVGVPQIVKSDSFKAGGGRQSIEPLSDGIGVRRSAVLKREDVVARAIVGPKEVPLVVL